MADNKNIKPSTTDKASKSTTDDLKINTHLGITDLERKKKVDPGVE